MAVPNKSTSKPADPSRGASSNASRGAPAGARGGSALNAKNAAPKSPNAGGGKAKRTKESTKRQSMLNTHKIQPFKYDMNEILGETAMDPSKASAFLASVIAKASRVSTKDAKDFVRTFVDSEDLAKEEADRINRLIDKYSKYR